MAFQGKEFYFLLNVMELNFFWKPAAQYESSANEIILVCLGRSYPQHLKFEKCRLISFSIERTPFFWYVFLKSAW